MQNNQQDKDVNLVKIQAERGFYILTNVAFLILNCFLLSNAYGLLIGVTITIVLSLIQRFLILRIYNLKRCISMIKMLNTWAKAIDSKKEGEK